MRGCACGGGRSDGQGCDTSSSTVAERRGGRRGDNVLAGEGPLVREFEGPKVGDESPNSGQGGTEMAMLSAMLPPAENPLIDKRVGSRVIVWTCSMCGTV